MKQILLLFGLALVQQAYAFSPKVTLSPGRVSQVQIPSRPPSFLTHPAPRKAHNLKITSLMAVPVPDNVAGYIDFFTRWSQNWVPDLAAKFLHPLGMLATVAMATAGARYGFMIRNGEGGKVVSGEDKTARDQHKLLMILAAVLFLEGFQGGLVFVNTLGGDILQSPHFISALLGLSLLAVQALLPLGFSSSQSPALRTAHTYLGSAIMLVLFVNAGLGLKLGYTLIFA
ncbi:unnamed protein product [Chrysoparadoxa australica]